MFVWTVFCLDLQGFMFKRRNHLKNVLSRNQTEDMNISPGQISSGPGPGWRWTGKRKTRGSRTVSWRRSDRRVASGPRTRPSPVGTNREQESDPQPPQSVQQGRLSYYHPDIKFRVNQSAELETLCWLKTPSWITLSSIDSFLRVSINILLTDKQLTFWIGEGFLNFL